MEKDEWFSFDVISLGVFVVHAVFYRTDGVGYVNLKVFVAPARRKCLTCASRLWPSVETRA
jgi:hypothetical protein